MHICDRMCVLVSGVKLAEWARMQGVHPQITNDVFAVLGVENSVNSRMSYGGTAPARVREQILKWRQRV